MLTMKQITQIKMAETLGVTPAYISQILNDKLPLSWKLADKMAELFPGKTIKEWKNATPTQIRKAFSFLE